MFKAASKLLFVTPSRLESAGVIASAKARIFSLCPALQRTVRDHNKHLSLKFFEITAPCSTDVERSPVSLVGLQLQGRADHILHKLGQSPTGWPRGFYVVFSMDPDFVFSNGRSFLIGGFLPKFMNDNVALKRSDLDSLVEMVVTPKLSGSLAMVACFRLANFSQTRLTYAVAFSKNSMEWSSGYVQCATDAFAPILESKPALLDEIVNKNLTVCGEGIYPDDPCHGAIPTCAGNEVVVTCISSPGGQERFVEYLAPRQAMAFCESHGLPWSGAVSIRGPQLILKFFHALENRRDVMTWSLYQQLIGEVDDGENLTNSKAVDHRSVLGETLEGLVVFCYRAHSSDAKPSIFKYKFPKYTCRTFGVRPKIADCVFGVTSTEDFLRSENFAGFVMHATSVIERWTAEPSSDAARQFLTTILLSLYLISDPAWRKSKGTFAPKCKAMVETSERIARKDKDGASAGQAWRPDIHISAFEEAEELVAARQLPDAFQSALIAAGVGSTHNSSKTFHLVAVLGPIGSGKSAVAGALANKLGLPHLDGDWVLGVEGQNWSIERNDATISELVRLMLEEGGVVLSQGGGILFDKWHAVVGKMTRALSTPQVAAKIQLYAVLPAVNTASDGQFEFDVSAGALREVYLQHDVARVVRERVAAGLEGWKKADPPAVKKQSNFNLEFAHIARDVAGPAHTFFWRYSKTGERAETLPDIPQCAGARGDAEAAVSASQLRIACQVKGVKKVKHVTVAVDFSLQRLAVPCALLGRKDSVLRSGLPLAATRLTATTEFKPAWAGSSGEEWATSEENTSGEEFANWMVKEGAAEQKKAAEKKKRWQHSLISHVPKNIAEAVLDRRLLVDIPKAASRVSHAGLELTAFAHVTESVSGKELQPAMNRDIAIAFLRGAKTVAVPKSKQQSLQFCIVDEAPSEVQLVGVYAVL